MRFYYRGEVKVPFEPRPELIGVKLKTREDGIPNDLAKALQRLDLREYTNIPEQARADGGRIFSTEPGKVRDALSALQQVESVSHAGAIVGLHDRSISFLTNELIVRFRLGIPEEKVRERFAEVGVNLLRRVRYMENAYHGAAAGPATYEVLDQIARIAEWEDVDWAEPNLVTTVELDQVIPTDFLWPGVWDRQLVNTPGAWAQLKECGIDPFGSPKIVIAFVDQGIQSAGGVPSHPEFQGAASDGSSKVYRLFDFNNLVPNNDAVLGDHGMGVSGVGAAKANNDSVIAGQDEGLAGAAPGCRVMGLIYPASESDQLDMYVWAAGFDPGSPRAGFPGPISPGADVFSTSIGFGDGAPISAQAAATFDFLVTNGRGGRGCLCFFSTGNENNDFTTYRPWAAYQNNFGITASTLANDGVTEIRAPYSGFGPAQLCAPSHDELVGGSVLHNPPANYGTWSAHLVGTGNLVGHAGVQTILTNSAAAGDVQLTVASAFNFVAGGRVLVGPPGTAGSEPATITGPPSIAVATIPITPLMNPHPLGTVVVSGANNYRNNFGGTSSATPLSAGVAALVLSAKPELTFVQARQILQETAVKIDPNNADPVGQWLDINGNPSLISGNPPVFSRWFGYGRINAEAAVRRAGCVKDEKPRIIYQYSVKFVCGKSEGKILSRGHYYTAINVHNPTHKDIRFRKKIAVALPGERPGHVTEFTFTRLGPDQALEIDCPDIYRLLGLPEGCLLKGFVVIESAVELDVVTVYTATGNDRQVETIHTERVPARPITEPKKRRPEDRDPRKLADLVPVPPFPPAPPFFPSNFCNSPGELAVIVRNQGNGPAGPTTTRVDFFEIGVVAEKATPALGPEEEVLLSFDIRTSCYSQPFGGTCNFRITVNARPEDGVAESDTTNNTVQSSCTAPV
ncbi:MAG: S8 family serine peptidase [bacterium]